MRYPEEVTKDIISSYLERPNRGTVEALSEKYNKTFRQIISKLVTEQVYVRPRYLTKSGERPVTKSDLVSAIAKSLGYEEYELEGLENTPKGVLRKLLAGYDPAALEELVLPLE